MKIWIVGAGGLLGSSLVAKAPKNSIASTRTDVDVCDFQALEVFVTKHPDITHIVNCAALAQVDIAEKKFDAAHRINAIGPENLGRIASKIGAKIIHISTDYVFPGDLHRPLHEEDSVGPVNHYGKTKLEGERRLLSVFPSACILRTSCLFGHGGKNFVARMFNLFKEKEEILLANDQTNSPTYVEDFSQVILQMLERDGVYHFSNRGMATKYSFGSEIFTFAKKVGLKIKTQRLIPVPSSTFTACCPRPMFTVFDISKIAKVLKKPIAPWEESLHTFLEGFL